jgi:tetratricopeptide (TPR) repeat protein
MKHIIIFFLSCILTGCNDSSTKTFSAINLNDSAIAITNHYKDTSKFDQAIALLNKAIKQDSTIFDLYKNKYFFEATLGDYKSALKTNIRLITFRPDSADLYFQAATFEQFLQDTIQAKNSFTKAALLYKATLDTMSKNSPYYFYDWRLWACSMIMIGKETIIHDFLKENCTNSIDSVIYNPQMLNKTKQELQEVMNKQLIDIQYRR